MDYAVNKETITTQQKSDNGALALAYDMAFAKLKKERKENKKHA